MKDNPLFSVIIPTYNRASFIQRTIHSVLQQTFSDFEIIVVDDGSTDNTEEEVASVKDARIIYYKKENAERAAARNYGIAKSTGSYITFLDSDDLLKENHLEEAVGFLKRNPNTPVFHLGYDMVKSNGEIIYLWKALPDPANEKLLEGNFLSCLGVFIERNVALSNRFNEDRDLSGSEDYELWIRLAAKYPVRTCAVSTACLVNHDERSVLNANSEKLSQRIALVREYLSADERVVKTFGHKLNVLFGFHCVYEALHQALGKHRKASVRALGQAIIRFYPQVIFHYRFWVVLKKLVLK